jgi:hypothetical protein
VSYNGWYVGDIGSIAIGYLFVLFYGILLLGPVIESLSLLVTLLMIFAGFSMAWTVYGCIAISNSTSPCVCPVYPSFCLYLTYRWCL